MRIVFRAVAVLLVSTVATLLTAAQGPAPAPSAAPASASAGLSLTALAQIEPGLWQFDVKGQAPKAVCIADGSGLVQIAHDQPGCSRFVIANDPKSSTVHYSCQAAGWGRTTIRPESPRAAQIQTQGILRNAPFDFVGKARWVGACNK